MSVISRRPAGRRLEISGAGHAWAQALLLCGVVFPLLWVGMDIVASLAYEGYSYVDQTVSELSAVGAPTRSFWMAGGVLYGLLEIAFAAGVWQAAGHRNAPRIIAVLFAAHAVLNLVAGPFSSMHQREVLAAGGSTFSDTLHVIVVGIGAVFFFLQIALATTIFGRYLRLYSIATIVAMLVFGFIASTYAPEVQDNEPTPWAGIYERINAYGYMLWVVVFATALWARRNAPAAVGRAEGQASIR